MHGPHLLALACGDKGAAPFEMADALVVAKTGGDPARQRQRQPALETGEARARCRGSHRRQRRQLAHQASEPFLIRAQTPDLLRLIARLKVQAGEQFGAPCARGFERLALARAFGACALKFARLRLQADFECLHAYEACLYRLYALGARLMQQTVVGHDACHPCRLFLIKQQLEWLLLAHGMGRTHLALERTGLMCERAALVLRLGAQLRELTDVGLEAAVEAALRAQRFADAPLKIAQLFAHGVAPALKFIETAL